MHIACADIPLYCYVNNDTENKILDKMCLYGVLLVTYLAWKAGLGSLCGSHHSSGATKSGHVSGATSSEYPCHYYRHRRVWRSRHRRHGAGINVCKYIELVCLSSLLETERHCSLGVSIFTIFAVLRHRALLVSRCFCPR